MAKEIEFTCVHYLISDWDGTLVDSMPAYTQSFIATLHAHFRADEKAAKDFYWETTGMALSLQFKIAAKKFGNATLGNTITLEEEFWKNLTGEMPAVLPRAKEFLADVKKMDLHIVIWSG